MKQVLQNLKSGQLIVADVPPPRLQPRGVLIATAYSLISAGTERARVDLARRGLVGKARERPDQVRQVLNRVQREGLRETYQRVMARLDTWESLGYSCSGIVVEAATEAGTFRSGDRVAGAGGGFATHAEINFLPRNLCVPVPDEVDLAAAAYGTVGAVALHGVRQAEVSVGEFVAVIGLGLVGQLTVQILRAAGCRVAGLEPDATRRDLAGQLGADLSLDPREGDAASRIRAVTGGLGADAVILTADTASDDPIEMAAAIARDRATVVAVGAVGLGVPRRPFYEKELQLRLSRSYGPGRYDPEYEQRGVAYPPGYVRWTETANLAAFLQLIAAGRVDTRALTSHEFPIDEAPAAYDLLTARPEPSLGVLLRYDPDYPKETGRRIDLGGARPTARAGAGVSFIGAGTFARGTLLPAVAAYPGVTRRGIVTATGATSRMTGERFGFAYCASDPAEVLSDSDTAAVFIATRHADHANLAAAALRAGKHVFVEKPLALTRDELEKVVLAHSQAGDRLLMVGFNRRFAPLATRLRDVLREAGGPFVLHARVNAGPLSPHHWLNDPEVGGGRLFGEACHFIDLLHFLAGAAPVAVSAVAVPNGDRPAETAVISLAFADGSIGNLVYAGDGDPAVPKERIEVFGAGVTAILDDCRTLQVTRDGKTRTFGGRRQDKGHGAEVRSFLNAVTRGGPVPAGFRDLVLSSLATLAVPEVIATGCQVGIDLDGWLARHADS